ncbi:MAG: dimethylarginine dimethylaminohydrolase family protein, partial [Gemmatimonadaceae bacterium]
MLAITRSPATSLANCELTYLEREPIDVPVALEQHRRYEGLLRFLKLEVKTLPADEAFPDSCFVEDTALVLDDVVVLANPGVESRRGEIDAIAPVLAGYRPIERIAAPATFDGGDILVVNRTIYVGVADRVRRTNPEGAEAIRRLAEPRGYEVRTVPFDGCLHLLSAVTQVGSRSVLLNPDWVDPAAFAPLNVVRVPTDEPKGANTLRIGETVLMPASAPATAARL